MIMNMKLWNSMKHYETMKQYEMIMKYEILPFLKSPLLSQFYIWVQFSFGLSVANICSIPEKNLDKIGRVVLEENRGFVKSLTLCPLNQKFGGQHFLGKFVWPPAEIVPAKIWAEISSGVGARAVRWMNFFTFFKPPPVESILISSPIFFRIVVANIHSIPEKNLDKIGGVVLEEIRWVCKKFDPPPP